MGRFGINETDDACEAFEAILGHLHKGASLLSAKPNLESELCADSRVSCIAHEAFHIDYEVVKVCKCGMRDQVMRSDPQASYVMTLYPEDAFK